MTPADAQKVFTAIKHAHGYIRDMTWALGGADDDDKVLLSNLDAAMKIMERVAGGEAP